MNTLVVYWSWTNGNTEKLAKRIAEECNADIEKLELVKDYEGSYDDVVKEGKEEADHHTGRAIQPLKHDLTNYDRIVIGTPTWWYTMAPCVYTFLKEQDFTGKTVVPFMTNAGWPGTVIKDMMALMKGATVENAKEITFDSNGGDTLVTPQAEVEAWIESFLH